MASADSADKVILDVAQNLEADDFDFSVTVDGWAYDVYRFTLNGKEGQLAFRIIEGKVEIAMFDAGRKNEEQVAVKLRKQ